MKGVRGTRVALLAAGLAVTATAAVAVVTVVDRGSPASVASASEEQDPPSVGLGARGAGGYASDEEYAAIQQVLDARAEAVLDGDREAFLATVDDADPRFVRQQLVGFDNLQRLGVVEMVYGLEEKTLPVTPVSGNDPEVKPDVTEHVQLRAVDQEPVSNEVGFTFVDRDGTWLLGAERIAETQETLSSIGSSRPWAEAPLAVRRAGVVTVVVDRDRAAVLPGLTRRVTRALGYVQRTLGLRDVAPLLVDATSSGNATRLSYEGLAVAGAVFGPAITTTLSTHEPIGVAGWRVKYNPDRLAEFLFDDRVLRHELTHFVLREKPQPLWLSEGLAEHVGWQRTPMSQLVVPAPVYDRFATEAPRDRLLTATQFRRFPITGYPLSQALAEELLSRGGVPRLRELLDALARSADDEGSAQQAFAASLREVYGLAPAALAEGGYQRLLQVNRPS